MYQIFTETSPDSTPIECPNLVFYVASLEIVVKDEIHSESIILSMGGYSGHSHGEANWAFPCTIFQVPINPFSKPVTLGKMRELCRKTVPNSQESITQLAFSTFGLRNIELKPLGHIFEIKKSPRPPYDVRGYYFDRWQLVSVGANSHLNLADFECRFAHVFAPINTTDSGVYHLKRSETHDIDELWFLGKPLHTNIRFLLESPEKSSELRQNVLNLEKEHFHRQETGLILAGDLAGYGTTLKFYNERSLKGSEDIFRHGVVKYIEDFVTRMGTTQVQIAGDGFLSALPSRVSTDFTELCERLVQEWEKFLLNVDKFNRKIPDQDKRTGSRLALFYSDYLYGRVSQTASFQASFDGASIIQAVRMEQALGSASKACKVVTDAKGKKTKLDRLKNYITFLDDEKMSPLKQILANSSKWEELGLMEVEMKESKMHVLVFEFKGE